MQPNNMHKHLLIQVQCLFSLYDKWLLGWKCYSSFNFTSEFFLVNKVSFAIPYPCIFNENSIATAE